MQYPNVYIRVNRVSKGRVRIGMSSEGFDPTDSVMGYKTYKYNVLTFEMDRKGLFKETINYNTAYNAATDVSINSGLSLSPEQELITLELYRTKFNLPEDCVLNVVYR